VFVNNEPEKKRHQKRDGDIRKINGGRRFRLQGIISERIAGKEMSWRFGDAWKGREGPKRVRLTCAVVGMGRY
jgi:hypothetical protein